MSTEEIIDAWKHNEDDPKKPLKGKKKPEVKKTPANPAGEQEISDEDLKAVEGGIAKFTCNAQSC